MSVHSVGFLIKPHLILNHFHFSHQIENSNYSLNIDVAKWFLCRCKSKAYSHTDSIVER